MPPRRLLRPHRRSDGWVRATLGAVVLATMAAACGHSSPTAHPPARPSSGAPTTTTTPRATGSAAILPSAVLIADEGNNRLVIVDPSGQVTWEFPQPGDLPAGVDFRSPDDAFFTPDGHQIIATEEEFSVITLIDIATRRIVWRHGTPGRAGGGPTQLSNPDDAIVLPDGSVLTADIKNCRLLLFGPGGATPARQYGTSGVCRHNPPAEYGSPNGAFPMTNGHYLVTEINGDWVDEIDLSGRVYWSVHPPGIAYPSDSNEVAPGHYLTVDYSAPGAIETFDGNGQLLWRYAPGGTDSLNHPSLALPLPNGDIIATDDHNDRVIVVDPKTNQVVWQYGVRGRAGAGPGLLDGPDGLDLSPPYSDLVAHAATMGRPA